MAIDYNRVKSGVPQLWKMSQDSQLWMHPQEEKRLGFTDWRMIGWMGLVGSYGMMMCIYIYTKMCTQYSIHIE